MGQPTYLPYLISYLSPSTLQESLVCPLISLPSRSFVHLMLRGLFLISFVLSAAGFRVPAASARAAQRAAARSTPPVAVVIEISSQDEFDKALEGADGSLVVIDYSTSWCGPCKIIAPKFDEFSEQYKNVAFLKAGALTSIHSS